MMASTAVVTFVLAGCVSSGSSTSARESTRDQVAPTLPSRTSSGSQASSTFPTLPVPRTTAGPRATGSCPDGVLAVTYQPLPFQATGDRGQAFRVTNRGMNDCFLDGYPRIVMRDSTSAIIPFHYTDGQSQYVTSRPARRVVLHPGGSAYIAVAKYGCDEGPTRTAATLSVTLPGQRSAVTVAIPTRAGQSPTFQYCKGEPNDRGNFVALSPVEPDEDALQRP
ncbi:MAG TPA: DUF4232 domain-containing protein [Jatrophihabitans sp.]|nr:DUF4232 domain-containing protein [Jatrophihabitans sp.]